MSKVVVLGSANTDLTVYAQRLPRPHETVTNGKFRSSFGGKGANQALAALKAGAKTSLLAKIGVDDFGNLLYRHLVQSGLPEAGLIRDKEFPAGIALIAVDEKGNNQIIVAPGSNANLSPQDVQQLGFLFEDASVFLAQLEVPLDTVQYALKLAKAKDMTTILNPAPFCPLPQDLMPLIDILTPNEREAAELSRVEVPNPEEAEQAAFKILAQGCSSIIVTLGEQGAVYVQEQKSRHFTPYKVRAVDSVAAGDAFNGALAAALSQNMDWEAAISFASAAGALSATRQGAQDSLPTREEIIQFQNSQI